MDFLLENEFSFLASLFGVLFLLSGLHYKFFPPKRMTWYAGVQTKAARRNQQTWKAASLFIAGPMIFLGLLFIAIASLPYFFGTSFLFRFGTAFLLIMASLLWLHTYTERHLDKLFDHQGNKLPTKE